MKIMAIIDVAPTADLSRVRERLREELRGSWALYEQGVLREAYTTAAPTRVVFVLEAESSAAAHGQLRELPLVASGEMKVELIELRPFVNWQMLFSS